MNYQILARKYRPQNFAEMLGQEKIVTLLQNALKKNRIGQSYLFSGPRGVGKTTTARILVKYLNCETTDKNPPCNECSSCIEINRGISLDYLEIDGASNRGIDQIRELNEQLNFASPKGKYRVFVIDEVHMLTTEAFNALLKSLEEPPPKFIFVLCTTESYRIPLTIRSRCQQLFFGYIDTSRIATHLESLLKKEGHEVAPDSLIGLAKKSEGSIRDAENLLEKVIAYSDGKIITAELIEEVLGETPIEKKYAFLANLTNQDLKANVELVKSISISGYSINEFFYHIVDTLSTLIYYQSGIKEAKYLGVSNEELQHIKSLEAQFSLNELFTLSDLLFDIVRALKNTTHYQATINYMLIKLHRYKSVITAGELKENILKLSKYITPAPESSLHTELTSKMATEDEPIKLTLDQQESPDNPPKQVTASLKKNQPTITSAKPSPSPDITPPTPTNPTTPETLPIDKIPTPSAWVPWTEEDYKTFLQILKEDNLDLFRLTITFRFIRMETEQLILENKSNHEPKQVDAFVKDFTAYINLTKHQYHPLLKKLIHPQKRFSVQVTPNIVQSNLEKIKKIFPIQE